MPSFLTGKQHQGQRGFKQAIICVWVLDQGVMEQAAYKHVPKLPQLGPDDPGPFSFASEARVTRILSEAGFSNIAMERCDLSLDTAVGGGLEAAVEAALEIGPTARALAEQQNFYFPVLFAATEVAGIYNIIYRHMFDRRRDLL